MLSESAASASAESLQLTVAFPIVHDNLYGGNRTPKNRLITFCVFTDPELERAGRNESKARHEGIEYRLAKMPITQVLRTRTVSKPRGFMKLLITEESDEILSFSTFAFGAGEIIAAVQTAMLGHLPYTILRDAIFTHPAMSEELNQLLTGVTASSTQTLA
jgi:pyruvate/2-oxoglutarate dehydrogenase complex dihydrolipoamide dehydrogenase (E3) component